MRARPLRTAVATARSPAVASGPGHLHDNASKTHGKSIGLSFSMNLNGLGYGNNSRAKQAQQRWIAAKERLERVTRDTERQTRDAYLGIISDIARVQSLRQALESSRTALTATEAGMEVGTRTIVDVLNSRQQLIQAETSYSTAKYQYLNDLISLQLAAGSLDRATLEEINGWLTDAGTGARHTVIHALLLRAASSCRSSSSAWREPGSSGTAPALARAPREPRHLRVAEQRIQRGRQFRGAFHHHQTSCCAQPARHFRCVGIVRAGEHGLCQHGRLQQIVATHRHQAAADEGHVARGIPGQQRADLIDQQDFQICGHGLPQAGCCAQR